MPLVIYATPFLNENAVRYVEALGGLPDVQLGVISQDAPDRVPPAARARIAAHWRVGDTRETAQLRWAAESLAARLGPIHRFLATNEHLQIPLSEAREQLGIGGMSSEVARNFRDKARMKSLLRAAGLPCARHLLISDPEEAWPFVEEVGYPLVVKPPSGAAALATFRVNNRTALQAALQAVSPSPQQPALLEQFLVGQEHSCDTLSIGGEVAWRSISDYLPSPLEVLENPWIQWRVVLPREINRPGDLAICDVLSRALHALGREQGMSHTEWFELADGSVAISEIGARPPGAQFTTLIGRAHDCDFLHVWARLMVTGEFEPPQRVYAAGAAYLRGQGSGRVKAIHGLEQAQREVGELVTDVYLPAPGATPSGGYEGDGYVIVRHHDSDVVEQALLRVVSLVRVELG
jgi:phosphoserine phosphatase